MASLLYRLGRFSARRHWTVIVSWVLVIALAAVGLLGHWRAFAGAGARPLLLGGVTWAAVAGASLAMQAITRQL